MSAEWWEHGAAARTEESVRISDGEERERRYEDEGAEESVEKEQTGGACL